MASILSSKLGASESYAADIRAGRRRPRPRHWLVLARSAEVIPGATVVSRKVSALTLDMPAPDILFTYILFTYILFTYILFT
jgi:hypothetical protein